MPRSGPSRLTEVAEAATLVFRRQGYRRTHVADVAAEAGLSAGAVYTYVESKEALFHLVFAHAFGVFADGTPALPLATPKTADTVELIARGLREHAATPRLRVALEADSIGDVHAELAGIVGERFELLQRLWPVFAVIERSVDDVPGLDGLYFGRARHAHHEQLQHYLERRAAAGQLRPMEDPAATARIVTEAITWFAWHRHEDPGAEAYDDDRARRAVVKFVGDALVAGRRESPDGHAAD